MGDDVGKEKASWVEDMACPLREFWVLPEKRDVSQFMMKERRARQRGERRPRGARRQR